MRVVASLILIVCCRTCLAWSEGGHHLISVMAYEQLSPEQQQELLKVLKSHPRFGDDFQVPPKVEGTEEINRWTVGRAAYWPDVARSQPENNRPNWHYQLGPCMVVGSPKDVPENPGPVPETATLATKDLHIAQALELCRKVLKDKKSPPADRAIAICWIAHLVGDAHQPCHSGSLYDEKVFPKGDRGANSIPTVQSKNMHALWDGLLGPKFDAGDVQRRERTILADPKAIKDAQQHATELSPLIWLKESAEFARSHVYTVEVMKPINSLSPGSELEPIKLSEDYLKNAGELARERAAFAAYRLMMILKSDL